MSENVNILLLQLFMFLRTESGGGNGCGGVVWGGWESTVSCICVPLRAMCVCSCAYVNLLITEYECIFT